MARISARLADNAPGDYFVDDSCIDCETCRIVAPQVFERSDRLGLDHAQVARRFGCTRVMHRADVGPGTRDVEQVLEGDEPLRLAPDLLAIPLPGHTRGSQALLYRDRFLFTGDHLWAAEGGDGLDASSSVCWYSWTEQIRSMKKLLAFDFEWVLPGHGPRFHANARRMRIELEKLIAKIGDPR